jgi:molybdopterin-guanine dinucleotide biosynthesis protein B
MKVFGIAGWSGSGKTTLVEKLIAAIAARGLSVSSVKHAHEDFDIDRPGKDSHRHRLAGATEVLVSSPRRWALVHELRGAPELGLDDLLARLSPVDLVLVEGFKSAPLPKLEVHDPALGKPLLAATDPQVVALAWAGTPPAGLDRPVFARDDAPGITAFILAQTGLG